MSSADWMTDNERKHNVAKKPNAMSLDDEGGDDQEQPTPTITNQEAPPDPAASRQGDQHRPYCRTHNVLMRAAKTTSGITSYACPVPNCKATEKRAQPTSNVPREPMHCPHCAERAREAGQEEAPPVYLEADYLRSTFAMLAMVCPAPECHFSVRVPRPDIAARQRVQARRAEQIGER